MTANRGAFAIVVGHYSKAQGHVRDGISEWHYNIEVAQLTKQILMDRGHVCFVYHHYDKPSYSVRQSITAAQIGKTEKRNNFVFDAHIELHYNAFGEQRANGHEVLYHHQSSRGKELAEHLNEAIHSRAPWMTDRGVKPLSHGQNGFGFVTLTNAPRALVEPFFATNDREWGHWRVNQALLAEAYADGLEASI